MVVLVVVLHSIGGFGAIPGMSASGLSFGSIFLFYLEMLLETFLMAAMFFIAGYFTIPSLVSKQPSAFLRAKLWRLGVPLLIGSLLLVPISSFIQTMLMSAFNGTTYPEYFQFWTHFARGIFSPHIGPGWNLSDFSQGWLWFLSLLLFFQVMTWLLYHAATPLIRPPASDGLNEKAAFRPGKHVQAIIILITALSFFIIEYFLPGRQFVTIWNLLLIQPNKVIFYLCFYCLGMYGYEHSWYRAGKNSPFPLAFWLPMCGVSFVVFMLIVSQYTNPSALPTANRLFFAGVQSILCFSLIAVTTVIAQKYWHKTTKINVFMAKNAYTVYIIHFPVVLLLKYPLMTSFPVPPFQGFSIVVGMSLLISFVVSDFIVRPHPRIATAALVLITGLMFVLI